MNTVENSGKLWEMLENGGEGGGRVGKGGTLSPQTILGKQGALKKKL